MAVVAPETSHGAAPAPEPTAFPPDLLLELIAGRFRLLSDAFRLKILLALGREERSVSDIVRQLGANQSTVSKHLAILSEGGLIRCRREGRKRWYAIAEPLVFDLYFVVRDGLANHLAAQLRAISS